jgi:serine/threonine-protein kinase
LPEKPGEATLVPSPSPVTEEKPAKKATSPVISPPRPAARKAGSANAKSGEKGAVSQTSSSTEKKKAAAKPTATVVFAVTPWGEVYVDGKQEGISPPLKELILPPGKHIIEVRNTTFPPYKETVDLAPEANAKVKHKFQ